MADVARLNAGRTQIGRVQGKTNGLGTVSAVLGAKALTTSMRCPDSQSIASERTCVRFDDQELQILDEIPSNAQFCKLFPGETKEGLKVVIESHRCFSADPQRNASAHKRFHLHAFICSGLSHSNIVPFLGVFSSNQFPCACIFKLVGNECLREYLVSNPSASRLKLLVDIARGLHHIHDLDIVHRRIKDTNIRISDSGTAMIAGFASATLPGIASEGVDESAESNASRWCSPEIIRSSGSELTKASDIYAFGMLAYEIFSGRMPFHDKLDTEAVMIVTTTNQRPPRPIHQELSGELWHMIERCWQEDPSQRPTIQEVVAFLEK